MFVEEKNDITNKQHFEWIKERWYCLVVLSFSFLSFLIIYLSSVPPFSISSLSFFPNPNKKKSLLLPLLNHLSLFITFFLFVLFFLLLSLCLVLFFQSLSFVFATFLFHSFEISFRSDIGLFSVSPILILRFPLLKVVISFFLYSILLKHAAILIERFGQTCMTKEQSEMLTLMNHPFTRPLLHCAVRCTYRP